MIDATVPLAAAVGGRATRTLGVPQGSAAQQAQEMVPDGVTVLSALHTVSAALLRDLDHELDEDVLLCGDKRADKRRAAALIDSIAGLRCVDCGRLEMARVTESMTALMIAVNARYKTHAGVRLTRPARRAVGGGLMAKRVVVLAGGTGGAKLARGMLDVCGAGLTVIANTADDIEIYGAYVSPDPDLVTFWLADRIDERGWGLRDDTFAVMDGLRELGVDVWFSLGDRDLAIGIERARRLAEGARLTEALAELGAALGVAGAGAPDERRARAHLGAGRAREWMPFQEFMIRARRRRARCRTRSCAASARRCRRPRSLAAIAAANAIIIGPSNPVISIGPILTVPEMRQALLDSPAPIVAVSPIVGGAVLKGPTEAFMRWAGYDAEHRGDRRLLRGADRRPRRRRARRRAARAADRHADERRRRPPPRRRRDAGVRRGLRVTSSAGQSVR